MRGKKCKRLRKLIWNRYKELKPEVQNKVYKYAKRSSKGVKINEF